MLKRIGIGCLAVLLVGLAQPARADLTVSIAPGNATIAQGGTGTINVYATWNPTSGQPSSVQINNFAISLLITQTTGVDNTPGFLQFSSSYDPSSPNYGPNFGFVNGSNYIFYNEMPDSRGPRSSPLGRMATPTTDSRAATAR